MASGAGACDPAASAWPARAVGEAPRTVGSLAEASSAEASSAEASARFSERIVALNLLAPLQVAQAANALMQAQPDGGCIVNIGSISAMIVNRPQWQPAYNASKAAVHQLTKSLAAEWAPRVRVNAVTAGIIGTEEIFEVHYANDEERLARLQAEVPMGRFSTPADVAGACLYLASPLAAQVTEREEFRMLACEFEPDLRGALEVAGRAVGDVAQGDLLGNGAAEQAADLVPAVESRVHLVDLVEAVHPGRGHGSSCRRSGRDARRAPAPGRAGGGAGSLYRGRGGWGGRWGNQAGRWGGGRRRCARRRGGCGRLGWRRRRARRRTRCCSD